MFSSIVRHRRQVFTFQFESSQCSVYVLQHLHSKGRIPPALSHVGGLSLSHIVLWAGLLACLNLTFFISSLAHISSSKPHGVNYYYHIKCLQIFSNLELHVEVNYKLLQWWTHISLNLITGCLPCSGRNYNNYISYVCLDLGLMVKLLLNWKPITIIGPFELSWSSLP